MGSLQVEFGDCNELFELVMCCNVRLEYKLAEKLDVNGSCVTMILREYIGDCMQVVLYSF